MKFCRVGNKFLKRIFFFIFEFNFGLLIMHLFRFFFSVHNLLIIIRVMLFFVNVFSFCIIQHDTRAIQNREKKITHRTIQMKQWDKLKVLFFLLAHLIIWCTSCLHRWLLYYYYMTVGFFWFFFLAKKSDSVSSTHNVQWHFFSIHSIHFSGCLASSQPTNQPTNQPSDLSRFFFSLSLSIHRLSYTIN